jgi:ankyrin repeat protein
MSEPANDRQSIDDQLFDAARKGDVEVLGRLLDADTEKLNVQAQPYEWSLLHFAARGGHLAAVDLLLRRGLDVNTSEKGDNTCTCAMHWAAAGGHLEIVRRLADGRSASGSSPKISCARIRGCSIQVPPPTAYCT